MAWHITSRMLRMIMAVADSPSMAAAAVRLNVTPSALSHQIRDAEAALRVALFERTGRKLSLTPLGEQLLASARIIITELERAEEALERSRKGEKPWIRVGGGAYPVHRWFLSQGGSAAPAHVDFIYRTNAYPLARAVAQGELDIAFAGGDQHERAVSCLPVFVDDLVAVFPKGHTLRNKPFVEASDLKQDTYITYSRVLEYGLEDDLLFRPSRHAPPRVMEAGSIDAILDLVGSGLGYSIVSSWAVKTSPRRDQLLTMPLTGNGLKVKWSALVRTSDPRIALFEEFVRPFRDAPPFAAEGKAK
ncbi:MAG TPA: LysR family transcriptional regulator [Rhizobiaceae bacterium]|nr:LysR family transcriptional regulator [Rhizobiaceae bacterium]